MAKLQSVKIIVFSVLFSFIVGSLFISHTYADDTIGCTEEYIEENVIFWPYKSDAPSDYSFSLTIENGEKEVLYSAPSGKPAIVPTLFGAAPDYSFDCTHVTNNSSYENTYNCKINGTVPENHIIKVIAGIGKVTDYCIMSHDYNLDVVPFLNLGAIDPTIINPTILNIAQIIPGILAGLQLYQCTEEEESDITKVLYQVDPEGKEVYGVKLTIDSTDKITISAGYTDEEDKYRLLDTSGCKIDDEGNHLCSFDELETEELVNLSIKFEDGDFYCNQNIKADFSNSYLENLFQVEEAKEDGDGDGIKDIVDNCPETTNALQEDEDGDNIGDACDVCPYLFEPSNSSDECLAMGNYNPFQYIEDADKKKGGCSLIANGGTVNVIGYFMTLFSLIPIYARRRRKKK